MANYEGRSILHQEGNIFDYEPRGGEYFTLRRRRIVLFINTHEESSIFDYDPGEGSILH